MKQLKRLDTTPQDPYRRALRSGLRSFEMPEDAFRSLERERPERIVREDDALLVAQAINGLLKLHYAFPHSDAFARLFPSMLERLLPSLSADETPFGMRLRLTEAPSRPFVEPLLITNAFELSREWLRMTLAELPDAPLPADGIAPGFTLRAARAEDAESIAEIDAAAFPIAFNTPDAVRGSIAEGQTVRILSADEAGRACGFLKLRREGTSDGYVSDIAVHPEFQHRGLGEAMMRWALAWFRKEGLKRAALTTTVGNAPAIALYRKLGFDVSETGLDYRRPLDEDEVRQVLDKNRTSHIRVRRLL